MSEETSRNEANMMRQETDRNTGVRENRPRHDLDSSQMRTELQTGTNSRDVDNKQMQEDVSSGFASDSTQETSRDTAQSDMS